MKVSSISSKKKGLQVRVQGQAKKEQKGIYNIKLTTGTHKNFRKEKFLFFKSTIDKRLF